MSRDTECEFCELDGYENHDTRCPVYLENRIADLEKQAESLKARCNAEIQRADELVGMLSNEDVEGYLMEALNDKVAELEKQLAEASEKDVTLDMLEIYAVAEEAVRKEEPGLRNRIAELERKLDDRENHLKALIAESSERICLVCPKVQQERERILDRIWKLRNITDIEGCFLDDAIIKVVNNG